MMNKLKVYSCGIVDYIFVPEYNSGGHLMYITIHELSGIKKTTIIGEISREMFTDIQGLAGNIIANLFNRGLPFLNCFNEWYYNDYPLIKHHDDKREYLEYAMNSYRCGNCGCLISPSSEFNTPGDYPNSSLIYCTAKCLKECVAKKKEKELQSWENFYG